MYHSFEELEVWKRSCRLAVDIYKAFDRCNDYGLKDQVTRAAVSVPSNIAEGSERDSLKEFKHFLHISKGSAAELRTQLYISQEIGVIPKETCSLLVDEVKEISCMLHGLIKSLEAKINS